MKGGSPMRLGILTGINGMAQVFAAIPSSIGADRFRRDTVARLGSVFGMIAILITPVAVYMESFEGACRREKTRVESEVHAALHIASNCFSNF
jgi:hypothetical protein